MRWYKVVFIVIVIAICSTIVAEAIGRTEIEDTAKIRKIMDRVRRVDHLHPFLESTWPVAVVRSDSFYVYDVTERDNRYRFIISAATPMQVKGSVRASFPLDFYGSKASCIITPDVLDEDDVILTLCHEFVHCGQWHGGEQEIRAGLDITRKSAASDDPMWEINYPFPYDDPVFVDSYSRFLGALKTRDRAAVKKSRESLKQCLGTEDYEYMVFQEWKEGLARYVENRVSRQLGRKENTYGRKKPFSRVTFYAGGSAYMQYLEREEPGITKDVVKLHATMNGQPQR